MISDAIGWKLSAPITQSMEPIVTDVDRKSPYGFAKAGNVAGCAMKGFGYVDGELKVKWIIHSKSSQSQLEFKQAIM